MASAKLQALARARRVGTPTPANEPKPETAPREEGPSVDSPTVARAPELGSPRAGVPLALAHARQGGRWPGGSRGPYAYSLLIVLNEAYRKFGTVLLNSLQRNADLSRIRRIYVGDVGLSEDSRRFFAGQPKVQIVDTDVRANFGGIHDDAWLRTVAAKSRLLLGLVRNETTPVCMLDADCLVVRDFAHMLDPTYELQVCLRGRPVRRRDGMVMRYIGSFLSVNSPRATGFLEAWVHEIERMYRARAMPAHETPALCRTIERFQHRVRIGALAEALVSCDRSFEDDTLVIHMKSNRRGVISADRSFIERVRAVQNFSTEQILDYLGPDSPEAQRGASP